MHTSILGVPQPPIGVSHQSHCHVAQRLAVHAAERSGLPWDCGPAMLRSKAAVFGSDRKARAERDAWVKSIKARRKQSSDVPCGKEKEPDPSGSAGDEGIHTVTRAALKDEWT